MFALSDIHVAFGGNPTLRGVSWRIEPGERVAIVGPNGAGKTTMLRLMAAELSPDAGEVIIPNRADVGYLPQDVEPITTERTLRAEVETVFAPVHRAEADMRRLEHEMAEIEDHESAAFQEIAARYDGCQRLIDRMEGHSIDARIGRVLAGLGFEEWQLDKPMRALSGGWQMRAHLAKLLLSAPDLMLLDEPTNHLDLETMLWLEDWIRASNAAVLMVSHERAFMDRLCHRIFELHAGTIEIFKGNYSRYLAERDQRREVQKRAFENQQREINQTQRFIDRFRAKATKASQVQSRVKALEKLERVEPPPSDPRTIHFQFPPVARSGKEVLSLNGVSHTYTDAPVISDVNLTLYRGDRIALVGVNGAGKSTLLKILSGRMGPSDGKRDVGLNTVIDTFTQGQWDTLNPNQTVLQALQAAAAGESEQNLRSCLGAFCFSGRDVDKRVEVLSGGEKTRVRLAMMLFSKANVLLMDEPTNHLDIWSRMTLEDALRRYEGTLIVVSHDRYFLDRVTEKVIEIRDGDVHFYPGKYSDYLRRVESHEDENGAAPEPAEHTPTKHREANARATKADAKRSEDEQRLLAQINAVPTRHGGKKSKDQRRREAEERNRRGKMLKPLQRKAKKIEDEIQLCEIRVNAINTELTKPGAYEDQARVAELMKERKRLTTDIEKMTDDWEAALAEVEEIRGN